MLFSILFTYPKSENLNLVLVCNEGIQCTPKYFVIPFHPLAIVFDFNLVFAIDESNDIKTFKNWTPTAQEFEK